MIFTTDPAPRDSPGFKALLPACQGQAEPGPAADTRAQHKPTSAFLSATLAPDAAHG